MDMMRGKKVFVSDYNGDIINPRWNVTSICISFNDSELKYNFNDSKYTETLEWITDLLSDHVKLYELFMLRKPGRFNRIDKYYGIWKKLLNKNIEFSITFPEKYFLFDSCEVMVAIAEIEPHKIKEALALCSNRCCGAMLFFSKYNIIYEHIHDKKIFLTDMKTIDYLLDNDATIICTSDFYPEERVLYLYGKNGNKEIELMKSKFGLS